VIAELRRPRPPCAVAGGTGQRPLIRGRLETALCGDLTKVAMPEPRRSNGGVSFPSAFVAHLTPLERPRG
jgi:hypothetical protein